VDVRKLSNIFNKIKFKTNVLMVSSTYANILKYHIQGMPTNILLQVFI